LRRIDPDLLRFFLFLPKFLPRVSVGHRMNAKNPDSDCCFEVRTGTVSENVGIDGSRIEL